MTSFKLVLALGMMAALPAAAQVLPSPSTPEVSGTAPRKPPRERVICRTVEQVGSRLNATKQCATQTEWERMNREQRENLETKQSGGSHIPGGGL